MLKIVAVLFTIALLSLPIVAAADTLQPANTEVTQEEADLFFNEEADLNQVQVRVLTDAEMADVKGAFIYNWIIKQALKKFANFSLEEAVTRYLGYCPHWIGPTPTAR